MQNNTKVLITETRVFNERMLYSPIALADPARDEIVAVARKKRKDALFQYGAVAIGYALMSTMVSVIVLNDWKNRGPSFVIFFIVIVILYVTPNVFTFRGWLKARRQPLNLIGLKVRAGDAAQYLGIQTYDELFAMSQAQLLAAARTALKARAVSFVRYQKLFNSEIEEMSRKNDAAGTGFESSVRLAVIDVMGQMIDADRQGFKKMHAFFVERGLAQESWEGYFPDTI